MNESKMPLTGVPGMDVADGVSDYYQIQGREEKTWKGTDSLRHELGECVIMVVRVRPMVLMMQYNMTKSPAKCVCADVRKARLLFQRSLVRSVMTDAGSWTRQEIAKMFSLAP